MKNIFVIDGKGIKLNTDSSEMINVTQHFSHKKAMFTWSLYWQFLNNSKRAITSFRMRSHNKIAIFSYSLSRSNIDTDLLFISWYVSSGTLFSHSKTKISPPVESHIKDHKNVCVFPSFLKVNQYSYLPHGKLRGVCAVLSFIDWNLWKPTRKLNLICSQGTVSAQETWAINAESPPPPKKKQKKKEKKSMVVFFLM